MQTHKSLIGLTLDHPLVQRHNWKDHLPMSGDHRIITNVISFLHIDEEAGDAILLDTYVVPREHANITIKWLNLNMQTLEEILLDHGRDIPIDSDLEIFSSISDTTPKEQVSGYWHPTSATLSMIQQPDFRRKVEEVSQQKGIKIHEVLISVHKVLNSEY